MVTTSYRSSFSQHNVFNICPKTWYWSSILKVPSIGDLTHANAGNVVHKSLDKYYSNGKNIDVTKQEFEKLWKSFDLDNTTLKLKKDSYWVMVLNGINKNLDLTTTEMKIFYPEVVAYLDGVNTNEDNIIDWKTSTRSEDNEKEYSIQLKFYSWLYFRKFNRIPKKVRVYYLKYNGSKDELAFEPTLNDISEIEKWYNDTLEKMIYYINNPDKLPPFNCTYHWCPYKSFWGTETNGVLKFILHIYGNSIKLEGPTTELLEKGIKKKFSYELKNSHWIKKARPQAKTTIDFYNSMYKTLPIGFKSGLLKTLQDYALYKKVQLDLEVIEHRQFNDKLLYMPDSFVNGRILRDYQKEAVDIFLRNKIGILEIATGAGKTEIAIDLIRQIKRKTLFLVDKIELLRQTKKRIEDSLGINVGSIGAGFNDTQDITVATIQTLNKNPILFAKYLNDIRFVIFDETHKVAAKSYVKISRYLPNTEYRLGLSGTAFRDDGNDMMINAVTGYIIHNLNSKILIDKGWLIKPKVFFMKNYMSEENIIELERNCKLGLINETAKYSIYYDNFIVNNIDRNNIIYEFVKKHYNNKVLILTKLIEHGRLLQENIPNSQHLYGDTNKEERQKMFDNFVNGTNNVLISTISIFSEGIDIPSLDIVINASGNRGDVKTIQVLGRVLRKLEGKKEAIYFDFYDESKFFRTASNSRRRALYEEGHEVEIIDKI